MNFLISLSLFGKLLSAPSLGKSIPVECVYQGSKVFTAGGPYTNLYEAAPRDAKRNRSLKTSGILCCFHYEGKDFPLVPRTAFYNWIYINALMEHPDLSAALIQYDSFTDIEYNPNKSINCQAEAAALYVTLARKDLLDQCRSFEDCCKIIA